MYGIEVLLSLFQQVNMSRSLQKLLQTDFLTGCRYPDKTITRSDGENSGSRKKVRFRSRGSGTGPAEIINAASGLGYRMRFRTLR